MPHRHGHRSLQRRCRRVGATQRGAGRSAEAIALLQPVYDRFTEGFETANLKEAKALLDDLRELEKVTAT
jgi:predicted ATPase